MSPRTDPWEEISETDQSRYQPLVDAFIPAVRLDPSDLWTNFRAHHVIAILKPRFRGLHIDRIRFAIHFIWDAPTKESLHAMRPDWPSSTVTRHYERYAQHVRQWGPGDIELVTLILQRRPTLPDLDLLEPSQFASDEIQYRTGANKNGVKEQILKGNWTKLGNIQVNYKVRRAWFELSGVRPVLTMDSYHHSFFRPNEVTAEALLWPTVIVPGSTYFPKDEWDYFKVAENKRGSEDWELA